MSGKTYDPDGDNMSFKVIADHIRSLSFAIGDGALQVMKDAVTFFVVSSVVLPCMVKIGIEGTFLYKLVPTVGKIMESYYPEVP